MEVQNYTRQELAVGTFVIVGLAALGYLSFSLGDLRLWPEKHYTLQARFASVGDLKVDAPVRIAGVVVGRVVSISLDHYAAEVRLRIEDELRLPRDTVASVRTEGLLGQSYVELLPGAAEKNLAAGERISQTEPAVDLIQLFIKYGLQRKRTPAQQGSSSAPDPLE